MQAPRVVRDPGRTRQEYGQASVNRSIVSFHQDEEAHWVARLDCGHDQHTRDDPPLIEREWIRTPEGRASRLGHELDCVRCDRHETPDEANVFHRTEIFDQDSVPGPLQQRHRTGQGIWARLTIVHGSLVFVEHEPFGRRTVLAPDVPGVVVPEVPHQVEITGPVRFLLEFARVPG